MSRLLSCLVREITQTRICLFFGVSRPPSTYRRPVRHTAVASGAAEVACLSPHWLSSPARPFLGVSPPLLYWARGVCTRGEPKVPGGEATKPSLWLFYCFTCVSVVACVSSEMIRMGLFFNQTQFCFLTMIFSDLLIFWFTVTFSDLLGCFFLCFLRLWFFP